MDEQDLNSSVPEVAPQSEDAQIQETPVVQQHDDVNDRNWREMRQRQKELEAQVKQRDELLEKVLKMQQPYNPPIAEEPDEPDDDYIPKGKVKGIAQKAVAPLEDKIKTLEARLAQQEVERSLNSLKAKYSDFDDVVNVETLELLEKKEPELAAMIGESNDPYKMAIQSYKYIKSLGLADQLPSSRRVKETTKKIAQNENAVQSPMAYDKRPMAQAFRMTEAEKTKLYEEMMYYAQQANGL